jgi:hypothetical protein
VLNMLAVAAVSPISLVWSPPSGQKAASAATCNPFWTPAETMEPNEHGSLGIFYDTVYGWTYWQVASGRLAGEALRPLLVLDMHGVTHWRPTNLGLLLGLPGLTSLLPLLLLWAGAGVVLVRGSRDS